MTREAARPLRRYEGRAAGGFATAELHHHPGVRHAKLTITCG